MASVRNWRSLSPLNGPYRAQLHDIAPLNVVFSDAFTERYRRDGMVGVRVPNLNPQVWRYAIEDAADGAMLWRDSRGEIAAFNMVHHSGAEGWMGPLAVRTDYQGTGTGKTVVDTGVRWLKAAGTRVIGLETMPRTMDNIGFYSSIGFLPGFLTLTFTLEAANADRAPDLFGRLNMRDRDAHLEEMRALVLGLASGYDFTREVELTDALALGDTLLLREQGAITGFAICHTTPLVEGRTREELRVLKLVLRDASSLEAMTRMLRDYARRSGTRRVSIRLQGGHEWAFKVLVSLGGRIRWTDLRMSLEGFAEKAPERGLLLSNWEI